MDGLERAGHDWALELRAGVIRLRWARDRAVTEGAARDIMTKVSALVSRKRRPLLVDAAWMEALQYRARTVFAASWPLTRVAVIGSTPVDEVVFVFYVARYQPLCTTRYFTSEADAVTWLKTPAKATPPVPLIGAWGSSG
ncbi:STAS/SEC14 domain-containing protein [Pseudarthrobacter sp. NPDC080037]